MEPKISHSFKSSSNKDAAITDKQNINFSRKILGHESYRT